MSLFIDTGEVDSPSAAFGVAGSFYGNRGNGKRNEETVGGGDGYGLDAENNDDSCSSESSSIGIAGESSASLGSSSSTVGAEEDEEVESKIRVDSSGSMDSLEESLPVKRGLSNFFNGKSKSFTTLSDVVTAPLTANDLAKPENPFNKRRRILMANRYRWPRRASCGSLSTVASSSSLPPLPPVLDCSNLFSLVEDEEVEDEREEESFQSQHLLDRPHPPPSSSLHGRKFKDSFKSPRSFSLSDLQQHANQFSEP